MTSKEDLRQKIIDAYWKGRGLIPRCRDCADENGRCPNDNGRLCDSFEAALEYLALPRTDNRAAVVEQCAQVCDRAGEERGRMAFEYEKAICDSLASDIRALADTPAQESPDVARLMEALTAGEEDPQQWPLSWLSCLLREIDDSSFGRIGEDEDPSATWEMINEISKMTDQLYVALSPRPTTATVTGEVPNE